MYGERSRSWLPPKRELRVASVTKATNELQIIEASLKLAKISNYYDTSLNILNPVAIGNEEEIWFREFNNKMEKFPLQTAGKRARQRSGILKIPKGKPRAEFSCS